MVLVINKRGLTVNTTIDLNKKYLDAVRSEFIISIHKLVKFNMEKYLRDKKFLEDFRSILILSKSKYDEDKFEIRFDSRSPIYKKLKECEYNFFNKKSNFTSMFIYMQSNLFKFWNDFLVTKGIVGL